VPYINLEEVDTDGAIREAAEEVSGDRSQGPQGGHGHRPVCFRSSMSR
jgi:hypothetical protein